MSSNFISFGEFAVLWLNYISRFLMAEPMIWIFSLILLAFAFRIFLMFVRKL